LIEIDGAYGEGGGQILRMAVALAALAKEPVRVFNIRAGRRPPGLKAQHLAAIRAVARVSGGRLDGDRIGSKEIVFYPGTPRGGSFSIDIGTAGSVTLVLQALIPAALFASDQVVVRIRGGTDVAWSPPFDYFDKVFVHALRLFGADVGLRLVRRGFYPKGGGLVEARIKPIDRLRPVVLKERGQVVAITGISYSAGLPSHIVERMARSCASTLEEAGYPSPRIERRMHRLGSESGSVGCGIVVWADTESGVRLGGSALGVKGKSAEQVGKEAALSLLVELASNAPVDSHLADMLVAYTALADGVSEVVCSRITKHVVSAVYVAERILGVKFEIEGGEGSLGRYRVRGCGRTRA